jgi:hypothetical protein
VSALVLTLVAFACLWTFWRFLNWVFDLIEQAHRQLREQAAAAASGEAMSTNWEKGSSLSSSLHSSSSLPTRRPRTP